MDQLKRIHNTMGDCANQLDRLNQLYPNLVSGASLEGVKLWKRPIVSTQDHKKAVRKGDNALETRTIAQDLLKTKPLEDVLDILAAKHDFELSLSQLVELIGKESYLDTLKKDASKMLENAISYEQIAKLWNDLDRPALGSPEWTARAISMLVE